MADRRCFHRKILESDQFYSLPASAQILYVHLNMAADDDGFVNCASSICARYKTGKADLKRLVAERFLLKFGEIYVIKHWRISNSLKNDRKKPLTYPSVGTKLWIKPNRSYTDHPVDGCKTLWESKLDSISDSQPNRTEPNRTEPNRTEPNRTEPKGRPDEDFQTLISMYPESRIGSVSQAKEVFRCEICSEEDFAEAMSNLALWKQSEQWTKDNGQYIPYLANWLDRGQWEHSPPFSDKVIPEHRDLDEDEIAAIRQMMEEDYA